MKVKFLNAQNWDFIESYESKTFHIDGTHKGFVSCVKIKKVKTKIVVDYEDSELCLFDSGYKCLIYLPDNDTWCMSVIYNEKDEIVEWYFDMTKFNSVDAEGKPYFLDLYLDIAVSPQFESRVLDEDELEEALHEGIITEEDVVLAHDTCDRLMKEIVPNKEFLLHFFDAYKKDLNF